MDQGREKREYMEKASRIDEKIASILKMQSGDIVTESMRKDLQKIQKEAHLVCQKLKNDEFEIAIVGLEKAGKSSFSNALIEENLLPTANARCTYTATCIRYAEIDNAVIHFYKKSEFEQDFTDKLKKLGIKNADNYGYQMLSRAKYEELYLQCDEDGKRFNETLNEDVLNIIDNQDTISQYLGKPDSKYTESELMQNEFQKFIKEPAYAIAVKEVIIGSSALGRDMKNAIIYDVPGFNSPTEMHKEQTLAKMKSADAIIVVDKGDEPSITGEELRILRESDSDGTPLKDKLFVFANKSERSDVFKDNQEHIWRDWIRSRYVMEEEKDWRIIFGSAKAHLQSLGKIEGDDCIRAVEKKELPNGDGIDYMKSSLGNYNKQHRFKVLKRRIDKLGEDLKEIFKEVAQKYVDTQGEYSPVSYSGYSEMAMELLSRAQKEIPDTLNKYMNDIKSNMENRPLSSRITDKIREIVSVDKYRITPEEIEKGHADHSRIANDVQYNRVDVNIRSERCDAMYDRFSKEVVKTALDRHKECEENIVERCLDAIGVTAESRYRDELKKKLKELLGTVIGNGKGDYYQSLVERYSRDIYEILIYSQYNKDRLNRFYADADNFYSLSIFYKPENRNESEEKTDLIYKDMAIRDLPMCRRLLFHTTSEGKDKTGEAYKNIKGFFTEYNAEIFSLVKLLGSLAPLDVDTIVSEVCRYLDDDDESTRLCDARELLKRKIREKQNAENIYAADILDQEKFKIQYERFHENRDQDYDSIIQDFQDDINILRDILCNAFVPAVNIEKPFLAKERKIIDDILALIKTSKFRSFLSTNMPLINYVECGELDEMTARYKMNEACLKNIQELLKEINV